MEPSREARTAAMLADQPRRRRAMAVARALLAPCPAHGTAFLWCGDPAADPRLPTPASRPPTRAGPPGAHAPDPGPGTTAGGPRGRPAPV